MTAPTEGHILLVDDEENILDIMRMFLERSGFRVSTAISGRHALEEVARDLPDLVVSDVNMPEMNGHEFFRAMQADPSRRHIPFIFLTACGAKEDILAGKELGCDDYLVKPVVSEELIASVRGKLKRSRIREEDKRAEVDNLKKEIVNVLTHEFVTPLVSIKGAADLLLSEDIEFDPNELRRFLSSIKAGGDRLGNLVNDFLSSVKIQAGGAREEAELLAQDVHLPPLIRGAVASCEGRAHGRGLTIEVDIPEDLPAVHVNDVHITDVLGRLLDNAIKFSHQDGEPIQISAESRPDEVAVSITDHGLGISPSNMAGIFDSFKQVDRQKMEQQGPGLGLYLSRGLVEANGGRITVKSVAGKGSTFTVTLPRSSAS